MTRGIFFVKTHAESEAGRLVPALLLFFKKVLYKVKKVVYSLISICSNSPQLGIQ